MDRTHSLKTAPDFRFCEDATFWDVRDTQDQLIQRRVLVSCDPNRKECGPWGCTAAPGVAKLPPNHDFHPLGMEASPSVGGNNSNLFVVNHARSKAFIEQFTISPSSPSVATHVRTLSSPYFISPNSIALTSPNSFYVTNDHFMTRRLPSYLGKILPVVETIFGLPLGWVSHVSVDADPASSTPILEHKFSALYLPFANGVSISPSGSEVAVASTSLSQVHIYSRDAVSNALKHIHTIPVPFSPDNLMFDETSAVIVAGHPHFPSLLQVPQTRGVETLFQSNGTAFSTSSTALRDSDGTLYVTGLYAEQGILLCRP
ncbi:hypothetical protein B0H10DRAFT_2163794 [Mycena sp. CBHHK59/15]|nr:hypothetical protein B0H10DRAFT_2163794 [Mycena sp. CBHHK59/15]